MQDERGLHAMNYHPPATGRIPTATALYGVSRSHLYRLAGEGRIRFLKAGRTTLVDLDSVRAYLATLPEACIAGPKAAA
jgi:excisionase family DNA binding protein